jgi:hypothetical protein
VTENGHARFKQPLLGKLGKRPGLPPAASSRGSGSLMPDVFSRSGINSLFGNIGGMIAHPFEATANENQIQLAPQLIRILRHPLD